MDKRPPKFFHKFLRWFCHPDLIKPIEGDLIELYEERVEELGKRKADQLFRKDVLLLFRRDIIKPASGTYRLTNYGMFKHNIKVSIRSFRRYKASFIINLVGLSIGIASTLLIYLWVNDEITVDKFHERDAQLYRVMGHFQNADGVHTWNGMPAPLASALKAEFPEIEKSVGATDPDWGMVFNLATDAKKLKAVGKYASSDYFNLFSYDMLRGQSNGILAEPNEIVISDELAYRIFNTLDVIGETIEWSNSSDGGVSKITGVFQAPPSNSTDQFDFILPFETYQEEQQDNWYAPISVAYVLVNNEANIEELNDRLADFMSSKVEDSEVELFLKKYSENYLYGNYENGVLAGGRIQYVQLFSMIAIFILIIACINFMNLSTARASRRSKELGIKKAAGATRMNLIVQYLSESILMAFISLIVAMIVVHFLLPVFNEITDKAIKLSIDSELIQWSILITLIAGLVSGSYPALYLSKFNVTQVLKGKLNTSNGELWVRKGLVVFQFTLSIIFIVSVIVIYQQVQFVQNKHLGYDKENILIFENNGKISENFDTFITEMKKIPGIENASGMTNGMFGAPGGELTWNGTESSTEFSRFIVYYDFIETLGMTLSAGQTFSREYTGEAKIVINESAAKLINLKDPVGAPVKFWGNDARIVGIVKDFHFQSLREDVGPLFLHLFPPKYLNTIVVRLKPGDQQMTISRLEEFYSSFNPGYELDYHFLNQEYEYLYNSERKVGELSKYFASIAILISCLGLFGLAAFSAERRVKEIGIRKILGSSVFQIVQMLSQDFTKMVIVANLIALPVSYFLTRNWLQNFAHSIQLQWWFFVLSGVIALAISWITVGYQTFKAANANPVDSLKYE